MKVLKNIAVFFLVMIFMISSSGFVMYKTNCSCTGTEQTSIFVKPDSCEKTFHHHIHDHFNEVACTAHECHDCSIHTKSCGCDSPQIFFFKLKDKAVDDEVNFVNVQTIGLFVASSDILAKIHVENNNNCDLIYADPPPKVTRSLDFLIQIQQLKISALA